MEFFLLSDAMTVNCNKESVQHPEGCCIDLLASSNFPMALYTVDRITPFNPLASSHMLTIAEFSSLHAKRQDWQ